MRGGVKCSNCKHVRPHWRGGDDYDWYCSHGKAQFDDGVKPLSAFFPKVNGEASCEHWSERFPSPMTKQISRDDVMRKAELLEGAHQFEAAAMLRALMDRVEELEAWKLEAQRVLFNSGAEAGDLIAQLAAANERAEKAERQCEYSWGVIANAYEGDWDKAPDDWQGMAALCEWPRPTEIQNLLAETDQ